MKKGDKNQRFFHNSFFPKNHKVKMNFSILQILLNSKKGTHVGVVLSFAIFIVFLVFLYSIMEPTITTQKNKQFLLDYLERELIEQVSAEMMTMTIMVNKTITKNCIRLQNIKGAIENATNDIENLIIKDESNNIRGYSFQGQVLEIENPAHTGFFKIYYSEELERSPIFNGVDCQPIKKKGEYDLGLTRTDKYIFESKVIDLKDKHKGEYNVLKDELKIPAGSEFGFSFTCNNGTKIRTEEKKVLTSVYVGEIPIQYIDDEANINLGFMNIQVW